MKKIIFSIAIFCCTATAVSAQESDEMKYRRSSLYSILINHTEQKFASEIKEAFLQMPIPEKYNDHDLSVKVVELDKKLKNAKSDDENVLITEFLQENNVASRVVGKWFNRDIYTGACDMELVKERGLYNASAFDKIMAEKSIRSQALILDAGEDLIENTFVLVNDIRYIDKSKTSAVFGGILRVAGAFAGIDLGDAADLIESIKGFKVRINTFLYKLVWDEETAATFYKEQYSSGDDKTKYTNFEEGRGNYKLIYVGKHENAGNNTSFAGINEDQPVLMVRKACQRALDENIVGLQQEFEEFRTKSPILSSAPITASVGLKEGVSKDSKFEVLEVVEDETGSHEYKRVAIIKPRKNLIWDNRYMAAEEGAENAMLGHTTFEKVSGGEILPGMLIREID